jgi:4-hydroxythreonine-4-phosphate dehydrogenase
VVALEIGIIADDLSGGAECAAHALLRVSRSIIVLDPAFADPRPGASGPGETDCPGDIGGAARVLTVDTHTRGLAPSAAASRAAAAAAVVAAAPVVVKKVDSLLRGNVAAEVDAVARQLGRIPVIAVSNPALGRIVRDGVLLVSGVPLHETDLWQVEAAATPRSVEEALSPLRTALVPQRTVDAGVAAVARAVRDIVASGAVAVCDAATEADLVTIHAAATTTTPAALLVGSGAMADTAVRALRAERDAAPTRIPRLDSLLMVLGTRASAVAAQLAQLADESAHLELVDPARLLVEPGALTARLADVVPRGLVIVALDPAAAAETGDASRLAAALATAVAPQLTDYDGIFLSGGETARAVLDLLEVGSLSVLAELERGTVVSQTDAGHVVVTRPGSFGAPDSLVRTARRLLDDAPAAEPASDAEPASGAETATEPEQAAADPEQAAPARPAACTHSPDPPPFSRPATSAGRLVATPKENP